MWLSESQAQQIIAHARADAPCEACGIIAGRNQCAAEIIPIVNTASDPLHSYIMDERALVAALSSFERCGLELLGFYHSHPNNDPIPSRADIQQASYPDTPYLIVGLKGGTARLAAWAMHAGQVSEVMLQMGCDAPAQPSSLSNAEKAAVLLGALIALALLIVVSLTLLPPAPLIPR
ncbi:MAG: M67 family metallopeptidase [Chloroflexota bacterium]